MSTGSGNTSFSESLDAQSQASSQISFKTPEEQAEADARSVYVGNVDYNCSPSELQAIFSECGPIVRVTIPHGLYTRTPKGFAYIEFASEEARLQAIKMSGTMINGRPITVAPKRVTVPGMSTTDRRPRLEGLTQKDLEAIKNGFPQHGANGLNGGLPQAGMLPNGYVAPPVGPFFNGAMQGAPMPFYPLQFPYPGMYPAYPPFM